MAAPTPAARRAGLGPANLRGHVVDRLAAIEVVPLKLGQVVGQRLERIVIPACFDPTDAFFGGQLLQEKLQRLVGRAIRDNEWSLGNPPGNFTAGLVNKAVDGGIVELRVHIKQKLRGQVLAAAGPVVFVFRDRIDRGRGLGRSRKPEGGPPEREA